MHITIEYSQSKVLALLKGLDNCRDSRTRRILLELAEEIQNSYHNEISGHRSFPKKSPYYPWGDEFVEKPLEFQKCILERESEKLYNILNSESE